MNYETAKEIELRIAEYYGIRQNLVVPNVSWGLMSYECDLLIATKANYLHEVEIKVSKNDLIVDKQKRHGHYSDKVRRLYFAIPVKLEAYIEHIPERAGILLVHQNGCVKKLRESVVNNIAIAITDADKYKLARLGAMRIWGLKRKVLQCQ